MYILAFLVALFASTATGSHHQALTSTTVAPADVCTAPLNPALCDNEGGPSGK